MSEPERLQRGRNKSAETASGATFRERWKLRRAAKKRRIAAMSRRRRIARRVGILSTWVLGFIAVMMITAIVLFYTLSDVPRPETLPLPQTATILYSDGSVMGRIGSVNRQIIDISQVPEQVRWDVLAAEDRNFYNEPGVSISGTLRAAVNDVTGGDTQGGSGITQQYVKNAYLSNSRTLSRKLKELAIAVKLSREYSKDQILEFYLNTVYFGRGAYGIQAASQAYFRKDVSKLTVGEGAVLAALLRAPVVLRPGRQSRGRRRTAGTTCSRHGGDPAPDAAAGRLDEVPEGPARTEEHRTDDRRAQGSDRAARSSTSWRARDLRAGTSTRAG